MITFLRYFAATAFLIPCLPATAQWQVPDHPLPVARGSGNGFKSASPCGNDITVVGTRVSSDPACASGIIVNRRANKQEFRWSGLSGAQWRAISTINGASNSSLVFQNTTDNFSANFTAPLYLNLESGYGGTETLIGRMGVQAATDNVVGGACIGGGSATGSRCAYISSDGLANWTRIQPSQIYNPQEFNIYSSAAFGTGTTVSSGTTLTRVTGTAFDSSWSGTQIYVNGVAYRISSATASSLTISGGSFPSTATVNWTYNRTTGSATCNVSGTTVTRTAGDPFEPFISGVDMVFKINGTTRTLASYTDINTYVLSAPPGNVTGATCTFNLNINDQIATLRVQKQIGSNEENFNIAARAVGFYDLWAGVSGTGSYYPIRILNGGNVQTWIDTTGVSLGGASGSESLRVGDVSSAVNRIDVYGGATGVAPNVRSRGSDANVNMGIDVQGTGRVFFTSNSFANTEFEIRAGSGSGWLVTSGDPTFPSLFATGSNANINVNLTPKGTGRVQQGGVNIPSISSTDTLTNKSMSGASNTFTNIPISTAISGLGTGVATWLGTPSSANLAAALTDETGSGAAVFAGSPNLTGTVTIDRGASSSQALALKTSGSNNAAFLLYDTTDGGWFFISQAGTLNFSQASSVGGFVANRATLNSVGDFAATRSIKSSVTTVSGLSAITCNSTNEGTRWGVTDANATTFLSIVAGGGSNHVPVYCNGSNWVIGG